MAKLKLQFESNQQYQLDAIASVVDVFVGQKRQESKFTISRGETGTTYEGHVELGFANVLKLSKEEILQNVVNIQRNNHLRRSRDIYDKDYGDVPNFTVEMETGTGKTYVYTRTIMELNRQYGMTKFIIVVPSVAIREGVKKSLEITTEHFHELYPAVPVHSFVYNSDRLTEVRHFASSSNIEIMIINIDAFRKGVDDDGSDKGTNIHKQTDKLEGRKPIEFIQQTRPIVIIDEPQSVDNTDKSKAAVKLLNPLCILRYSATHRKEYNLLYRLGPVDAYHKKLVKQIRLASVAEDVSSGPYMKLEKVTKVPGGGFSAQMLLNVRSKDGKTKTDSKKVDVNKRRNLSDVSSNNVYEGWVVSNMDATPGSEWVEFQNGHRLYISETESSDKLRRAQIATTIENHLDKELMLLPLGIKVLSLFFLDRVSNYRIYNDDGTTSDGVIAQIFSEEYTRILKKDKYNPKLFDDDFLRQYMLNESIGEIHDGYFAMDKKGSMKDSRGEGNTKDDESAYQKIVQNKEKLLSLDSPLRFIFSHSALKEGWDNPNVFQVCTMIESNDDMTKRQKIGRGLRLCVNQDGVRVRNEGVNILTVIANESYKSFSENLQREIESDTNVVFGRIDEPFFEDLVEFKGGITCDFGYERSVKLHKFLMENGYIDVQNRATETLKVSIARELQGTRDLLLPDDLDHMRQEIVSAIESILKRVPILDAKSEISVKFKKEALLSDDFRELWNKIKYKTKYQLNFDSEDLIKTCSKALRENIRIGNRGIIVQTVDVSIERKGVTISDVLSTREYETKSVEKRELPDILSYVEEYTGLTRKTIARILVDSGTIETLFIKNPEAYMETVVDIINSWKRTVVSNGITYQKIGDTDYYAQELFEPKDANEIKAYLNENCVSINKSVYSHVIYDSTTIERPFAEKLDTDEHVKLFVKLPSWFKIDTPLGTYNPDWAIVYDKEGEERLYFVVETKGTDMFGELRPVEQAKIICGRKHFEALDTGVKFELTNSFENFTKNT